MLIGAIVCTLAMAILGLTCLGYADDGNTTVSIYLEILHVGCAVAMTVLFCLYSPVASLACGAVLTAVSGIWIISTYFCDDSGDGKQAKLFGYIMIGTDFVCAVASYLSVYHFLALGISCSVIFVLAGINIGVTLGQNYGWDRSDELPFNIVNIVFTVLAAAGLVTGYTVHYTSISELKVETEYEIFGYDYENRCPKEEADKDSLYYNEYYALKLNLNWSGLHSLATSTKQITVKVTFPAQIVNYISDGIEFTSDSKRTVWTYECELTSKTRSQFTSGYFVFNYAYGKLSIPAKPVKVEIQEKVDLTEEDEEKELFEYSDSCAVRFYKRKYNFTEDHCKNDLSVAEDGNYIVTVPDSCTAFKITVHDAGKTGIYYVGTSMADGEYFLLDIPTILKNNVSESVYIQLKERKESLLVEITAVGNDSYDDTVIEISYTVE